MGKFIKSIVDMFTLPKKNKQSFRLLAPPGGSSYKIGNTDFIFVNSSKRTPQEEVELKKWGEEHKEFVESFKKGFR